MPYVSNDGILWYDIIGLCPKFWTVLEVRRISPSRGLCVTGDILPTLRHWGFCDPFSCFHFSNMRFNSFQKGRVSLRSPALFWKNDERILVTAVAPLIFPSFWSRANSALAFASCSMKAGLAWR